MDERQNAIEQFEKFKKSGYMSNVLPSSWSIELAIKALKGETEGRMLPCKVGDKVYRPNIFMGKVYDGVVDAIYIRQTLEKTVKTEFTLLWMGGRDIMGSGMLGKDFYLSPEEAAAVLEKEAGKCKD